MLRKIAIAICAGLLYCSSLAAQHCVSWYNGYSYNDSVTLAADILCTGGVIAQYQDAQAVYNSPVSKKEAARLISSLLFRQGQIVPSDYYPTPFTDLTALTADYEHACKVMLYLDYTDGVPPFSRDCFAIDPDNPLHRKGEYLRALLEAWNIAPDMTGANASSSAPSAFYTDVSVSDPNYGWIHKAYSIGLLTDLPLSPCGNQCFQPAGSYSAAQLYVLLYRLLAYHQSPALSPSDFFTPNNFTVKSLNNATGLDRAVFSTYTAPVLSIPGGGLPLGFSHSYRSDLTELPLWGDGTSLVDKDMLVQAVCPLGVGWTHSYNIFISSICTGPGSSIAENALSIHWADGTTELYDLRARKYTTPGIRDMMSILAWTPDGYVQTVEIRRPDGMMFHFDLEYATHILRLYSISDRNNNQTTLTYEPGYSYGSYSPLRLHQVTDGASGRYLTFGYLAGSNFINSVIDPMGRRIMYDIDPASGDLQSYINGNGHTTSYQYDQGVYKHLLTQVQKPNGNFINNSYQGRKLNQSQNGSYVVQVSFSANYLANSQTSATQVSTYNSGQSYNVNYMQDSRGNPTRVLSATQDITITYDTLFPDRPSYVIDNNTGVARSYRYDSLGNTVYSGTIAQNIVLAETSEYGPYNNLIYHTDANGNGTRYIYNLTGNLIRIEEPDSVFTYFDVNGQGNVTKKTDASGISTEYGYNTYGNINSIHITGSSIYAGATYDGVSRITSVTNPNRISTVYSYDSNNNLTHQYIDPSGLNLHTSYVYDHNDNATDVYDPRSLNTHLTYDFDTDDLLTEQYGPFSRNWTYNTDGSTRSYTSKNNFVFQYLYYPSGDPRCGLLQTDGYSDYDYNLSDRKLSSVSRGGYRLNYSYDAFRRTNSVTSNDMPYNTVSYEYDNVGNVIKVIYPSNTNWYITYEWDANNRLSGVKKWDSTYLVKYHYRKNGQIEHEELGNGTATYYKYDTAGRLDSMYTMAGGRCITASGATLDDMGNHLRESWYVDITDTTGVIHRDPPLPAVYNYSATNRLDNTNLSGYQYDNNGNLIAAAATGGQYNWDERDRLQSYTTAQSSHYYEYDPLGNRRRCDTLRYGLDILGQSNVLTEADLNGNPQALYVHGLGLVCRIDAATGQVYYYHYDFRGSTIAITGDSARIAGAYQYDPFGAVIMEKRPPFTNPFIFVGKSGIMADDTDMYFMRARYYQPSLGRFLSEDPVWSTNLFPYAGNNPVANVDPSGEDWQEWIPVYGSARDAYRNFKNGQYIRGSLNVVLAIADLTGVEDIEKVGVKVIIESGIGKEARELYAKEAGRFFEGTTYTGSALRKMKNPKDLFHSFPKEIEALASKHGKVTSELGGDGKMYQWLRMKASYLNREGTFEFIKNERNQITHRYFNIR